MKTPDYTGLFVDGWLRKQKRAELVAFLLSDATYAIVEGPPGSLKAACVQRVAGDLNYALREIDVEKMHTDDSSRQLARTAFSLDIADSAKGNANRKVVTLVYNVNIVKTPAHGCSSPSQAKQQRSSSSSTTHRRSLRPWCGKDVCARSPSER